MLPALLAVGARVAAVSTAVGAPLIDLVRNLIPRLEDEAVVEVVGQPGADKKRLYYLALAAANGLARQFNDLATLNPFLPPPMGVLMIEYDAADQWVRCTIRYSVGTLGAAVTTGPKKGSDLFQAAAVYQGPNCDLTGQQFGFTGNVAKVNLDVGGIKVGGEVTIPGIPASSEVVDAPRLEFAGRTILTGCPVVTEPIPGPGPAAGKTIPSPNPKPPGDDRSRGTVITPAVGYPGGAVGLDLNLPKFMVRDVYKSGGGNISIGNKESTSCCAKSYRLVPLVYAALTDPGGLNQTVFTAPVPRPPGRPGIGG